MVGRWQKLQGVPQSAWGLSTVIMVLVGRLEANEVISLEEKEARIEKFL